ncbi:sensor histidine kinase [Aquimarina pacifica]|uniref:sensor histidine kinase n=1 Tax=Aquimarina pacifica TaxID=1296415 RepID=UPI000470182C|nr:PAS domain-containing sensor histidine kinase [Aquimarina pacifica]
MHTTTLHYKNLFELSQDLIVIAGLDGFFKKINPQWTKKLGYSERELLSVPFIEFVHPDDKEKTAEIVKQQIEGLSVHQFSNRYIGKQGQVVWLEWNSTTVDSTGTVFAIARDKTLTKEQEHEKKLILKELKAKNKQLRDYANITSHDLRSPIANIFTLSKFLKDSRLRKDQQEYANLIQNCAETLNSTLEDLINALKINQNTDLKIKYISLEKTCNKAIQELSDLITSNNARIYTNFNKIGTIEYSETYMYNIFLNLISNALKYRSTERAPVIHIESRKKNDAVQLIFTDNGSGIDVEKHRNKIFGFRKTFHGNPDAKGFGLFMTKSQVEALNGKITIHSEPEKGTIFTIDIVS